MRTLLTLPSRSGASALLVVFLTATLATTAAQADEASHRKAVLELFQLIDMINMLKSSIEVSLKAQVQANPAIAPHEKQLRAFFNKYMSWESLKEEFAVLYQKAFSEAELKQLVAFYKTPVGKKTLVQMPELMQQGAQIGMARVQAHAAELQQMMQEPMRPPAKQEPTRPSAK
jgi:uncharacterized protein